MKKQILITIGREYGSGGHDLAVLLSQRLGIRMLDRELDNFPSGTKFYSVRKLTSSGKMTRKCSGWPRSTTSGR